MASEKDDAVSAYVEAAAEVMDMPLGAKRRAAVALNLRRIAGFAERLAAFELDDEIEIAGEFVP